MGTEGVFEVQCHTIGKSTLRCLDEEHTMFDARPCAAAVTAELLDPNAEVSWPDWWPESPQASASPCKHSCSKMPQQRLSTASTSAGSSCDSRGRRSSVQSRLSCASWASAEAEEPPAPLGGKSLRESYPLPVGSHAWDWPLSRDEKKLLVLLIDRQELMVQRDDFADQLAKRHGGC